MTYLPFPAELDNPVQLGNEWDNKTYGIKGNPRRLSGVFHWDEPIRADRFSLAKTHV